MEDGANSVSASDGGVAAGNDAHVYQGESEHTHHHTHRHRHQHSVSVERAGLIAPGSTIQTVNIHPPQALQDTSNLPDIGACKKCTASIWVHAPECRYCGYNPTVEQLQRRAAAAAYDEQQRAQIGERMVPYATAGLLLLFVLANVASPTVSVGALVVVMLALPLVRAFIDDVDLICYKLAPALVRRAWRAVARWWGEL